MLTLVEPEGDLPVYPLRMGDRVTRLDYFPFHVHRFLGARWLARSTHAERGAALSLWAHAVATQDPGGTLPDDDAELARLADFGGAVDAWMCHRRGALYGWYRVRVLDAQGNPAGVRLAHRVMTEVVETMWSGMERARARSRDASERRAWSRLCDQVTRVSGPRVAADREFVQLVRDRLRESGLTASLQNVRAQIEAARREMDKLR